jgi:hypothetical protein
LFTATAVVVFTALNIPFVLASGPERWTVWINDVLIFPTRYFGTVSANNLSGTWPEFRARAGVLKWLCFPFMYFVVPLIYILFFMTMRRSAKMEPDERWDALLLIAIVGIAMLAVMVPALSMRRVSCVSPPAMILLAWLLSRREKPGRTIALILGAVSILIAVFQIGAIQFRKEYKITLNGISFAIPDAQNYELYRWAVDHTRPGQWYFGLSPITLPLGLRNPTPIEGTAPGDYCRPEQVTAAIAGLERTRTPLLILRPTMYTPHLMGYEADHLQPFEDYLYQHYRRTKLFPNGFEAWERIDP